MVKEQSYVKVVWDALRESRYPILRGIQTLTK